MRNLKTWQKLALMAAVFLLPCAIVTYKMATTIDTLGVEFARQELRGLEYYTPVVLLMQDLQKHRALAAGWLNGVASFQKPLADKTADIEKHLATLDTVNKQLDMRLHTAAQWTALSAACRDLLDKTPSLSPEESVRLHIQVIAGALELIAHLGAASHLTRDPDLDSYYLMTVLIYQGPELSEILGQARAVGGNMTASKQGTPEQFARLSRLADLVEFLQQNMDVSLGKAFRFNDALRPALQTQEAATADAVRSAVVYIRKVIGSPLTQTSADDYVATLTRSIDTIFALESQATRALQRLLERRIGKFRHEVRLTLGLIAFAVLAVGVLGVLITRDLTRPLRQMADAAHRIAAGELGAELALQPRRDEIGALVQAFGRMRGELKRTVGEVQTAGVYLDASVEEIAASSQQQQALASGIAATTTEVSATSREISATARELVKAMNEVATAAQRTAVLAGGGQNGVSRMEQIMRQLMEAVEAVNARLAVLNEKAGTIGRVVHTITQVADQTNLLSLNAAIEAQKAGESGRGFAVVATEIRRLADQTAIATYDIGQMVEDIQSAVVAGVQGMDTFAEEVRHGGKRAQEVGEHLSRIIRQTQALAPRFSMIEESMQAQATGAEQIGDALAQLTETTQQTAHSMDQVNEAVGGLRTVSGNLNSAAERFKLA